MAIQVSRCDFESSLVTTISTDLWHKRDVLVTLTDGVVSTVGLQFLLLFKMQNLTSCSTPRKIIWGRSTLHRGRWVSSSSPTEDKTSDSSPLGT